MPNLTDVLETEDEVTVEEIAKAVCIPLIGGTLPTNAWINFTVDDTDESGFRWTAPNGIWEAKASHGTGYTFTFDSAILFEIAENAKKLESDINGLHWDGGRLLPSDPLASADAIVNIMTLTQAEYDAIGTPDEFTLYVING